MAKLINKNKNENDDSNDSGDELETPSSPIWKCPQFEKIFTTLLDYDWDVDTKPIESNIIHIEKDSAKYILYLFYGTGKSHLWLADEDSFNYELPEWYSVNAQVTSPVYELNNYTKVINSRSEEHYRPLLVMTHPNFIINAEDMIEIWGDTQVVSTDRLCSLIEDNEDFDAVQTSLDDIGEEPDLDKDYNSTENLFSKKALAEINAHRENNPMKGYTPNDDIDVQSEDFEEIDLYNVRFNTITPNSKELIAPLDVTCFRSSPNTQLLVWFDVDGEILPNARYTCELRDSTNNLIASETMSLYDRDNVDMSLDIAPALVGKYWFYIKHNGFELFSECITFVDYEKGYGEYIDLEVFKLFRINEGDYSDDYETMMERGVQSCFDIKDLEGVMIMMQFQNIGRKALSCQFVITVEYHDGKIVYQGGESCDLGIRGRHTYATEVRGVISQTGNYTVTVRLFDEVIFVSEFTVSHRDVRDTSKVDQIATRLTTKKNSQIKVENPMQELDSMIGLGELKKQLRQKVAKIQFDKIRQGRGLPTKPQQLHMAFLGNPGTGKTTVAKLLGQILNKFGILSKGHVVIEDRSTLMTQNWGGEGEMVNKALEKARGGILFIDEAYDLITESKLDPGKLIVSSLLQAMSDENNRDFMVIFAGYTLPMERLLSKNPGLRSRMTSMYFDDFNVKELMQIADLWLTKNRYILTDDARKYVESIIASAYASRSENFGNARYVTNLFENEIQPAMAERVMAGETFLVPSAVFTTIDACDVPNYNAERDDATEAMERLSKMVGLGELKSKIRSHLSFIRFVQARRNNKIDTPIPPLHMIFTGNPGTGKSSVAEYIGDIYRSMGLLSVGNVIKVTRADMIDQFVGGTEEKMKNLLTAAHGNILFIDEAYTLFDKNDKDVGKNAIEVLLDALGKENSDMIVILAGYPKEMEDLLSMNPGLKGRFPYTFNFEDYDEDELFEIAEGVVERNSLTLTKGATDALKAVIRKECKVKDSNFSNARFVVRLITTQVLPNMAMRLEGETDSKKLKRVLQRDIPIEHKEISMINENLFDEDMIETALKRLDAMVGLVKVKSAIHQFVDFARMLNRKDLTQIERYPLKWSFVGDTGTGKSSVAEILSEILKAMHLLGKGHTVEVKAEELYGVATHKADELLQKRMRESLQGLLFVDGDAPQFRAANSQFNPEYLRVCLAANTSEIHGRFAVVIAEQDSPAIGLAKSLNKIGISNFNHTLIFDNYTTEELLAILSQQLAKYDLRLSSDAATIMHSYISRLRADNKSSSYANARNMQELALIIYNMASASGCEGEVITADVVEKFATLEAPRTKIGY